MPAQRARRAGARPAQRGGQQGAQAHPEQGEPARQRRRRELTDLLPELFEAYNAPPDVVGVVLRFVGYDLPGTARLPDRDNCLKQHLSRL